MASSVVIIASFLLAFKAILIEGSEVAILSVATVRQLGKQNVLFGVVVGAGGSLLVFLALAIVGVVVALYHSYDEITAYSAPLSKVCNINSFVSCGSVFASGDVTFPPGT